MKTIGLIGGMSWESTAEYYKIINTTVKNKLGGLHSAKCILYSVDFYEIEVCQANGDWDKSAEILSLAAVSLEKAGADFIVICTNTMHKVVAEIQKHISVPILHIADVTADELLKESYTKVALLGTKYTMEQDFYKSRLVNKNIDVIVPELDDRQMINNIIYNELCLGIIKEESKEKYLNIINKMKAAGAHATILGCTEIGLLIKQSDTPMPLFDTSYIHAYQAAVHALA